MYFDWYLTQPCVTIFVSLITTRLLSALEGWGKGRGGKGEDKRDRLEGRKEEEYRGRIRGGRVRGG